MLKPVSKSGRRWFAAGLVVCAWLTLAGPAHSATALINALSDLTSTWNGTSQIQVTTSHCVASSTGNFQVRVTGSGTGGAFTLQNGAKLFVNYCLNCHSAAFMRYNRLRDIGLTPEQIKDLLDGKWYVNLHTKAFPGGEIRAQLKPGT